jgi:hypothetical protein
MHTIYLERRESMSPISRSILILLTGAVLPAMAASPAKKDDPTYVKQAAFRVDQQIAAWYQQQKLPVPATTDDATFLRRAFLVTIGRLPTLEEANQFLSSSSETKRQQLVDQLLTSPGYSSHLSNWAFDLLRIADQTPGSNGTNLPYRDWVRRAIDQNMPWDHFVKALVASRGDGWSPETASVGYYTRDLGMPLDNVANTMRVFLASRMECAQCHDNHNSPDEKPERKDFYQLAAFTHGQTPLAYQPFQPIADDQFNGADRTTPEYAVAAFLLERVYTMSIGDGGKGRIQLPSDYQPEYRNGVAGEFVGARAPFGRPVTMSDKRDADDGRQRLANWIVSETGAQFSSNIANRLWKRIMGKAVYEPIDTYVPAAQSNHPALMTLLEQLMKDVDYDIRAFQRVLLHTRTFQFATNPDASIVHGGDDFHGRKIERLSAEQIWDSLITLAGGNPDTKPRRELDDRILILGKPVLVGRKTMHQLSKEILTSKKESEVRLLFDMLVAEYKKEGNDEGEAMMMKPVATYDRDAQVRASELPSPAPGDHFLYLFGQSNREVVDAASLEANVGQVLSLMNGFVQRQLVNNPKAEIYRTLENTASPEEKIRLLYLSILTRQPSDEELGWMLDEIKTSGDEAYRNIVSALVMSSEFLFLQ